MIKTNKFYLVLLFLVAAFSEGHFDKFLIVFLVGLTLLELFTDIFSFSQKVALNEKADEHKELSEAEEWKADISAELNLVNRTLGYPNDDQFSTLQALFQLRCCLIAQFYHYIRHYQSRFEDGHWIKLFLRDYAKSMCSIDLYNTRESDEIWRQELKQTAERVFGENYNKSFSAPAESYQREVQRILLALHYWAFSPQKIIKILDGISTFGYFDEILHRLINEYAELDRLTHSGDFKTIFIGKPSEPSKEQKFRFGKKHDFDEVQYTLQKSNKIWEQLFDIYKISIVQRMIRKADPNAEILLKQLRTLEHMESHIDSAILQAKNESNSLGGGLPYTEQEEFFFSFNESNLFLNSFTLQLPL